MTSDIDPKQRRRRLVGSILGVAISIVLLYLTLRGVSFAEVLTHLRAARPAPLILAVAVGTLTFGVRTIRWRYLLRTEQDRPVAWGPLWHATAMGFMANNTLPLRMGEPLRAYSASRLGGVPFTAALSSIAVERALDALTIGAMLTMALFTSGLPPDTTIANVGRIDQVATRAGLICGVIFAVALFVMLLPAIAERLVRAVIPGRRIADRIVALIEGLRLGFSALRSIGRLVGAVGWSVVHWVLNAASFWLAFGAFNIEVGFTGAVLVMGLLAIGIAAPSSPGYFGIFELVVAASLSLFGVPREIGVAYGLTYHIATFIPITLLGLWSLAVTPIGIKDIRAGPA
jgi:glycosyltransferase 2 family protein